MLKREEFNHVENITKNINTNSDSVAPKKKFIDILFQFDNFGSLQLNNFTKKAKLTLNINSANRGVMIYIKK